MICAVLVSSVGDNHANVENVQMRAAAVNGEKREKRGGTEIDSVSAPIGHHSLTQGQGTACMTFARCFPFLNTPIWTDFYLVAEILLCL